MSNRNPCFDAETQRRRGCAEKKSFSAGRVSRLCGQVSALRQRRAARKQNSDSKSFTNVLKFLLSQFRFLASWPHSGQQSRRKLSASALRLALVLLALPGATIAHAQPAKPAAPLRIGVTLHPYYSWTANVVGNLPGYEVRALLPGDIDAGDYQPRPQDIKRLADLDVLIVNGIGHDDFIFPMLKASGNTRATVVRVNAETPMIRASGGKGVNSHTFISSPDMFFFFFVCCFYWLSILSHHL